MREIKEDFEQLEYAANLLHANSARETQLALYLQDQLAEILMFRRVRSELALDSPWMADEAVHTFSPVKKRKILNDFRAKVNFLNQMRVIPDSSAEIMKFAHEVRNQAYHREQLQRDIIYPVACTYFIVICELYEDLRIPHLIDAQDQPTLTFFRTRGVTDPHDVLTNGYLTKMFLALTSPMTLPADKIAEALSLNLRKRLEAILGTDDEHGLLEYLPDGSTEPALLLKRIQFAQSYKPSTPPATFPKRLREREAAFDRYRPEVTLGTMRKWLRTACALEKETNIESLLQKYVSINGQFRKSEELIDQAVYEYEEWIDMQINDDKLDRQKD